ncbi:hypothetical protein ORV05_14360 [Amycolatopsis cynarae]|uniref:Uncharacterized protein n=1 Tax=Amycolatopsis cynarae TaxID=2995223 RepID=A0ABY7BCM4_9PSEU|nr:hypothetical protein [Amycolatopsis sp. HUAS 11-8]WAL68893.1 hypothetical protein ORV05_14360 [Amycolatopsis sp. HUAS 11-8]
MTHEQTQAALDGVLRTALREGSAGAETRADFWLEQRPHARFSGPAVTVYYDQSIGLAGIAVNALRGPQVTLDGIALGLVLRVQRAGDLVLSRPVMVAGAWADSCWDTTEGSIPRQEWKTFEY